MQSHRCREAERGTRVVHAYVLCQAGDVVLLPFLHPVAVDGGAYGGGHDIADGYHQEKPGGEIAHGQMFHGKGTSDGIKYQQPCPMDDGGKDGVFIGSHRLVMEVHVEVGTQHEPESGGIDVAEGNLLFDHDDAQYQSRQYARNGPAREGCPLQITGWGGEFDVRSDKRRTGIDQHGKHEHADAVPRIAVAEHAQFQQRLLR